MAIWTYADWVTETDLSTRLTKLRQHIAEVSQRILEMESRSKKVGAATHEYLTLLHKKEKELEDRVDRASNRGVGRNKILFKNTSP